MLIEHWTFKRRKYFSEWKIIYIPSRNYLRISLGKLEFRYDPTGVITTR
jgi:hypothetical protein